MLLYRVISTFTMVPDPLSALGLAGNVVQFVQFISSIISKTQEIRRSTAGVSAGNFELKAVAENVSELSDRLSTPGSSIATRARTPLHACGKTETEEAPIYRIASSCKSIANELLSTVEELEVANGPHHKWRSFRQALKTVWKKDKISELQGRLDQLRSQMTIYIVSRIR